MVKLKTESLCSVIYERTSPCSFIQFVVYDASAAKRHKEAKTVRARVGIAGDKPRIKHLMR